MGSQRIVLADSDAVSRHSLKGQLIRFDYFVVGEAEDGITALKLVRSRQPDLLICKSFLPGMDGLRVAKIARQDKLGPVILICSHFRQYTLERAREAGVFSLLYSPLDDMSLLAAVELAVANYKEVVGLERRVKELEGKLETRKLVEKAKGILMETKGFSEAEAFSLMQKKSMNERKEMRAVAEAVVTAHSIMTGK